MSDLQSGGSTADSIEASLTRAFDEHEAASTAGETTAKPASTGDTAKPAAPAPVAKTGDNAPARDPAGKFAAKAGDQPAPGATDHKPAAPLTIEPLHHWPEDQKKLIRDLAAINPEMAQNAFNRLKASEDQYAQRMQQFKPAKDLHESLEPMLAKNRQARMMRGLDDRAFLQSVLSAAEFLEQNPMGGLQQLARQYGVDFAQLVQQQANQPKADPTIQRLEQEIAQLKQGFTGIQSQAQNEGQAAALAQLESFANAKDANGVPLRPHFNACLNEIDLIVRHQVQSGMQPNLQAAYDKATRMNDTVSQQVQAESTARANAAAEDKRKLEIAEAKRAGFSVTGSGSETNVQTGDSWGDALSRNFDKLAA